MSFDERRLSELIEESEDLHVTGMKVMRGSLDEIADGGLAKRARRDVAAPSPERRRFLTRSLFTAGALGTGFGALQLGRATIRVAADSAADIQMLQTAAAIEVLAIQVYQKAAGLPPAVSGASNPVILAFVQKTTAQHMDHLQGFNQVTQKLGGKPQMQPDMPVYNSVVVPALGGIKGPADVVKLALILEDAAAATYVKFAGMVDSKDAITALAQVAPVEAQHVAVLNAVGAVVGLGGLNAVKLPPDLGALPGPAGSVGFPNNFYKTDTARPADEGAVK